MNRGSDRLVVIDVFAPQASMRPRFMNRGSGIGFGILPDDFSASMRPRFMNRGSRRGAAAFRARANGFNEAPIHESGKCAQARLAGQH